MRAQVVLLLVISAAGCSSPAALTDRERAACDLLGDRRDRFEDAVGDAGPDRDAWFWLLERASRRVTMDGQGKVARDIDRIEPEFLSKRIEEARRAGEYPWAPKDEAAWRSGLLMYRAACEDLNSWFAFFRGDAEVRRRVDDFALAFRADPDAVLRALVHYLNADVLGAKVSHRRGAPPDLTPEACLKSGGGRATDLAVAAVCLLRTWGVAAAVVRTPALVRGNSGDAWVEILGKGWWIRAADASPSGDAYFRYRQEDPEIAKAWVAEEPGDTDWLRPWAGSMSALMRYSFLHLPARDAGGRARVTLKDLPEPAFLSVFAAGAWIEVAPGLLSAGVTDFGACGAADVLYLVTTVAQGSQLAFGDPFILQADGSREPLKAGPEIDWSGAAPACDELRVWDGGRFRTLPEAGPDRPVRRIRSGALLVWWKRGPENKGDGKPAGRPFVVASDGSIREF